MTKVLVAYFSASGITKRLAQNLAQIVDGDLFEVEPQVPYTDADLDWTDRNSRSTKEMEDKSSRPEIANKLDNMSDYDVVFLGFPIWWYIAPTIINTFLESYDMSGKTIIPFATSGGSGVGETNEYLKPSAPNSEFKPAKRLRANDIDELKNWLNSLGVL